MKWKTIYKDKVGNKIVYGKNAIGVKNAEGKLLNPTASKKFLREHKYKIKTIKEKLHAVKFD